MHLALRHGKRLLNIGVRREAAGRYAVNVNERAETVDAKLLGSSTVHFITGRRNRIARVARVGDQYHVWLDGSVLVFAPAGVATQEDSLPAGTASPHILAPMPGKVLQVLVEEGQVVVAGDGLLILEAMKMENRILAEADGIVSHIHVNAGQMIDGGAVLIELDYQTTETPATTDR